MFILAISSVCFHIGPYHVLVLQFYVYFSNIYAIPVLNIFVYSNKIATYVCSVLNHSMFVTWIWSRFLVRLTIVYFTIKFSIYVHYWTVEWLFKLLHFRTNVLLLFVYFTKLAMWAVFWTITCLLPLCCVSISWFVSTIYYMYSVLELHRIY